jgi:hypothetical protein
MIGTGRKALAIQQPLAHVEAAVLGIGERAGFRGRVRQRGAAGGQGGERSKRWVHGRLLGGGLSVDCGRARRARTLAQGTPPHGTKVLVAATPWGTSRMSRARAPWADEETDSVRRHHHHRDGARDRRRLHDLQPVPGQEDRRQIAGYISIGSDVFLRLIKMLIGPLVFSTLVVGIAHMGDAASVGRVFAKALGWFVTASLVSLLLGLIFANLLEPGKNLGLPLPDIGSSANLATPSSRSRTSSATWCRSRSRKRWPTTRSCRSWCSRCSSAWRSHRWARRRRR